MGAPFLEAAGGTTVADEEGAVATAVAAAGRAVGAVADGLIVGDRRVAATATVGGDVGIAG